MKRVSVLLALAGVGLALLLVAWSGAGAVWSATASIGWGGFLVLMLWQGLLFVLLALAWSVVMPGVRPELLAWGRVVRDSATNCLPFSPVGGFVIGARALTLQAVAWPLAAAGTVVDATAETIAQLLFALFGAAMLLTLLPGSSLGPSLIVGVGVALTLLLAALWQRRRIGGLVRSLGSRLLGDRFGAQGGLNRLQAALAALYVPRRLAGASMLHLAGWFATGIGTWITLCLLGAGIDVLHVVAFEALLDALIAAAFVVPGAAGVQEAGYVGLGALFGIPPDLALSASLLRRGKDLCWGLPVLGLWQWLEVRRLA